MAGSFSRELEDLLNPLPKFADPEDDADDATKARVIERFSEDDEDEPGLQLGALRKRHSSALLETDRRYAGRPVSRKQLHVEAGPSDEEEEEEDIEEEKDGGDGSVEEDEDSLKGTDDDEEEEEDSGRDLIVDAKVDFYKMTEAMDDLGVSEEEEDDRGGEEEEDDGDEGSGDDDMEQDAVLTFSKQQLDEEVEKGQAVKNQLALWDQLLEGRIKIQKALVTANQLPQPPAFPEFKRRGGAEYAGALKDTHKALKALQRALLELHDQLLYQNPDTRAMAAESLQADGEEEDREAPKRKLDTAEYPDFMAKRFAAFQPYRDATLQKWHDKTRLTEGKGGKGFGAFERNILTQVEQVLTDKERLLRRTQTRRSEYQVLGKAEASGAVPEDVPEDGEAAGHRPRANAHLKDPDEHVFDDDDFYHQVLRELIERRTSAADPNDQVAMGRQWLAIQRLRGKIKRKVDTKASKGRKVRFHVNSKLVNFMAPVDRGSMSDEARSELYRGLFAQTAAFRD